VSTVLSDVAPASAGLGPAAAAGPARRFRGKNKGERWKRGEDTELAVIRLPLDVHNLEDLHRLEQLYSAMWSLKRALQRDARAAVDAYWAGDVRREVDAKAWRQTLGLSREGMERRGYRHTEASRHLAHHVTKALVMHQADEAFETAVSRHLFPDATGRRFGRPRTGSWWDYLADPRPRPFTHHGAEVGDVPPPRHPHRTLRCLPAPGPRPVGDRAAAGCRTASRHQRPPAAPAPAGVCPASWPHRDR
jgi:hypothetical protein